MTYSLVVDEGENGALERRFEGSGFSTGASMRIAQEFGHLSTIPG
jgi:hypothetical protein